jgi:hypothetical protein
VQSHERISAKLAKFQPSLTLALQGLVATRRAQGLPVYDFGLGEAKGMLDPTIRAAGEKAFREEATTRRSSAGSTSPTVTGRRASSSAQARSSASSTSCSPSAIRRTAASQVLLEEPELVPPLPEVIPEGHRDLGKRSRFPCFEGCSPHWQEGNAGVKVGRLQSLEFKRVSRHLPTGAPPPLRAFPRQEAAPLAPNRGPSPDPHPADRQELPGTDRADASPHGFAQAGTSEPPMKSGPGA